MKKGVFKEELKNRFLCLVEVDGEVALCYIPSSCRLSNFVDLTDKTVLLLPVTSPKAKTKYSVYALCIHNEYILINMSKVNRTIECNIRSRRFSILGKRINIKKEHIIDGYKSDIYIEDTRTVVEIKSVLSFNKDAFFPSVYSQRAIDQLMKISYLLDKGYKACYIFVSLNPKVKRVTINTEIGKYQEMFKQCMKKGMMVKGICLKLKDGDPVISSSLIVEIKSK